MFPTLAALRPPRALRRRRRPAALLGALGVVVALTVAGCSREPTTYTDAVKNDFVRGCQQNGLNASVCTCTFEMIKAHIAFNDFKTVQSKLREDPKPLGQINDTGNKILGFRSQCEQHPG